MNQLRLRIYRNPGAIEIFVNIRRKDGEHKRITAKVDTGAQTSLLPAYLMDDLDYSIIDNISFIVERAGMADYSFEAIEAIVRLFLEDERGRQTPEFDVPVWFAGTEEYLVGFAGILDRAVLHLDMPNLDGYLDFDL
jgi:hypothetical protein